MKHHGYYLSFRSVLAAAVLATLSTSASAAFFQIAENSPAGLGNAFAGGSAAAEDASTVWYNPAGMTMLSGQQFVAGLHYIKPSTKFDKDSANLTPLLGGGAISGGDGGDAGEDALVPNFYYTNQLTDRLFVGLGINAPFGLATDYDGDWVGRYHADRSEITTININPAIAFKIDDQWSVGGGVNYQKIDAKLTQAVDYGSICALASVGACAAPGANDGKAEVEADDDAFGFNLGGLWQMGDTRVGAHYRSKMKYSLEGKSDVTAPSATAAAVAASAPFNIADADITADVTLPATLSLSLNQKLGPQWTLLADVTRTYWSDLDELRIEFDSNQSDSVVTLNLEDVYRYSIGANFMPGGNWTYRAGLALDQSPTTSASDRTPRLPDADRFWLALGAGYQSSPTFSLDLSYVYIMIDDAKIDKQAGTSTTGEDFLRGSLKGTYEANVQILSLQGNWKF